VPKAAELKDASYTDHASIMRRITDRRKHQYEQRNKNDKWMIDITIVNSQNSSALTQS
jgi:hypothetical protein